MLPPEPTRRLFLILVAMWVLQLAEFYIFSWDYLPEKFNTWERIVNVIFQASSSRTSGFNSIDLSTINPGTQIIILLMMYITAIPVSAEIRSTRVPSPTMINHYRAKKMLLKEQQESRPAGTLRGFADEVKRMALVDWLWLFIPFYIICAVEGESLENDPANFTYFNLV